MSKSRSVYSYVEGANVESMGSLGGTSGGV